MNKSFGLYFDCTKWKPKESILTHLCSCITQNEIDRLNKYIHKKDFKLGLIGQLLIYYGLSEYLQIDWKNVKIERNNKNRLFLKNKTDNKSENLDFNISHNGDFTVFALSSHSAIGVDVMHIDTTLNKQNLFENLKDHFDNEEWKQIFSQPEKDLITFFRLWCLKESLLKCIGIGLEFDLVRLKFKLCSSLKEELVVCDSKLFIDNVESIKYKFQENLIENHILTICKESNDNEVIVFQKINEKAILEKANNVGLMCEDQFKIYQNKE